MGIVPYDTYMIPLVGADAHIRPHRKYCDYIRDCGEFAACSRTARNGCPYGSALLDIPRAIGYRYSIQLIEHFRFLFRKIIVQRYIMQMIRSFIGDDFWGIQRL